MANDDLHPLLQAINNSIGRLREDVQKLTGEVTKIREAIREATTNIRDAIHENIQAQAELKLMDHVMDVRTIKPQIDAEEDQIDAEREELDARLASIGERYAEKHEELDEKARKRVRNLGEHIFGLQEDEYEDGIEAPFTDQVTSAWHQFQSHNVEVRDDRASAVRDTADEATETIDSFVDQQAILLDDLDEHRFDAETLGLGHGQLERLQVPYYVVEYTVDGVQRQEVGVPATVVSGPGAGNEWCPVRLQPIEGARDLIGEVPDTPPGHGVNWVDQDEVAGILDEYAESGALTESYGSAAQTALSGDTQLAVHTPGREN